MYNKYGDQLVELLQGVMDGTITQDKLDVARAKFNELHDAATALSSWLRPSDSDPHFFRMHSAWAGFMDGKEGVQLAAPPLTYDGEQWHLVGTDENDNLQVGINASNGKLYAGGGSTIIDRDGISDLDGNVAIRSYPSSGITFLGTLHANTVVQPAGTVSTFGIHAFRHAGEESLTNADFEAGALTGWTTTAGSPAITTQSPGEGKYSLSLPYGAAITQDLASSGAGAYDSYIVECLVKEDSISRLGITFGSNGGDLTVYNSSGVTTDAADKWVKALYCFRAYNDTTPTLKLYCYASNPSAEVLVDDVKVYRLTDGFSIGSSDGYANSFSPIQGDVVYMGSDIVLKNNVLSETTGLGEAGRFASWIGTIADDSVKLIKFSGNGGITGAGVVLMTAKQNAGSTYPAIFSIDGEAVATTINSNAIYNFTTGALTGTTGTDGKITLSVYNNILYIENRQGNSLYFRMSVG